MSSRMPIPETRILEDSPDVLYVAVGQSIGPLGDAQGRPLGTDQPAWWIRVGTEYIALDQPTSIVWLAAQVPKTAEQLAQVTDHGAAVLHELLAAQFVVALSLSDDAAPLFSLRVLSWGIGLGQDSAYRSDFLIASFNGETAITCDYPSYMLWTFFDGQRTVREVLERGAAALSEPPETLTRRLSTLLAAGLKTRVLGLDHGPQQEEGGSL